MHILLFTQYFPPEVGAPQTRLGAMTRLAVAAGHRVTVVTAMPSYPTPHIFDGYRRRLLLREEIDGCQVVRTWALPALGAGIRRMAGYASFAATGLIGLAISPKPDVLVVESPPLTSAVPAYLWAKVRRVPVVFNVADLWPDAAVEIGGLRPGILLSSLFALERWSYQQASVVSTVTDGVASRLIDDKGVPPEKILMVPNGVDTELFSPRNGDRSVLANIKVGAEPFVVYAGTMGLAHAIDELIEAFIESADPKLPHLLMIGSGSERERLERRVGEAGVRNIHFRDPVSPRMLATILPLAVAGVVTMAEISLNQTTRPAKMFPLMAAGLPVIYAGSGEGADLLRKSGGGLIVKNERTAIWEAVKTLANREHAAAMGALGRSYVEARWSWNGIVDEWLARLTSVVRSGKRSGFEKGTSRLSP